MSSWRDSILKDFTPGVSRLTLVADPDGLLLEEGILHGIHEQGFELIPFEDHVAFRYAYESKFRSRWDRSEHTDLVVVLRSPSIDLDSLPYDLLQAGRRLSFNLGDLFPNLSYPVVAGLDHGDLDALYEAQKRHSLGRLGDNATKEFALRHVYEIAPELIKQPSDLLRVLLRRHYRGQRIPAILDDRFIQILRQNNTFDDWPLETLVPDREAFFGFLQERWPIFLDQLIKQGGSGFHEDKSTDGLEYPGPADLPFDHDDIRVYIDNLFIEGMLKAVQHSQAESLSNSWISIGILTDDQTDRILRVEKLLDNISSVIPKSDSRHGDWFHLVKIWAELVVLALKLDTMNLEPVLQRIKDFQNQIDSVLLVWLEKRYAGLIHLPPLPPVMLHHIPRFIARYINDSKDQKVAFLLMDGLSFDQWIVIRKVLSAQNPKFLFRENAVFAWIPTITSVSRQAAFSGRPPVYFPNSIHTTDKEPALWSQFWIDQGLTQQEVIYMKGLGDGTLDKVKEQITHPKVRVAGLIIDKVDKIMHGMELGAKGMHNQVQQWAGLPYIANFIDLLMDNGFRIYLTSDHGNIEATGCGQPKEGSIAEQRGERARIYSDALLRGQVKERFPDSIEWQPVGLPDGYLPLLAPSRSAFVRETESLVGHGGISLEELVVPFVQIERKEA